MCPIWSLDFTDSIKDICRGVTLAVAVEEQLGSYGPVLVENNGSRIRHTLYHSFGFYVDQLKSFDRIAVRVRQQREGDLPLVGKLGQHIHNVVANSNHPHFLFFQRS
jgi:hypothetical protein